ncbi:FKBP-type peptidyl-prolyl cis-trans isomerase [Reichenbachiella agariperforans]|nr:FKBP-type peptidyl-prolyl cis-trans isomerase [Reichenbachiella agariperforans]
MNKHVFYPYIMLLVAVAILASCKEDEVVDEAYAAQEAIILDYLQENDLSDSTQKDESGIYYQIITENRSGISASTGDVLSIYYTAQAVDNQPYDAVTNNGSNEPVKMQFNTGSIFPVGLDISLGLMEEGDTAIFYIPTSLAYEGLDELSSIIPANSVIIMTVELVGIQSETEQDSEETLMIEAFISEQKLDSAIIDSTMIGGVWVRDTTMYLPVDSVELLPSGVYYKRTEEGQSNQTVNAGELADIQYLAYKMESYASGSSFDGTTGSDFFSFPLNDQAVITGLDAGVDVMEREERALLIMPSRTAYGASAFVTPRNRKDYLVEKDVIPTYASKVSPYQILVFEVELLQPQPIVN